MPTVPRLSRALALTLLLLGLIVPLARAAGPVEAPASFDDRSVFIYVPSTANRIDRPLQVVFALHGMGGEGKGFCQSFTNRPRATIALLAAVALLLWPLAWTQLLVIAAGGLIGWRLALPAAPAPPAPASAAPPAASAVAPASSIAASAAPAGSPDTDASSAARARALAGSGAEPVPAGAPWAATTVPASAVVGGSISAAAPAAGAAPLPGQSAAAHAMPVGWRAAAAAWVLLAALLLGLPILRSATDDPAIALADSFARVGSLVFGGGHVVLPLLRGEVVPPGWVDDATFLAGYGAAQAVPGPLFTFSAYLGAAHRGPPTGWTGATIALVAIFLPSFLLVVGAIPFWGVLRSRPAAQSALRGVNAAVVGILLAAFYQPVWTSAILGPADLALALVDLGLLVVWGRPPWLVVILSALAGAGLRSLAG